MLDMQMIGN